MLYFLCKGRGPKIHIYIYNSKMLMYIYIYSEALQGPELELSITEGSKVQL